MRNAHPQPGCDQGVAQFMQGFGDDQRECKACQPRGREHVHEAVHKSVPLPGHQYQPQSCGGQQQPQRRACEQGLHPGHGCLQKALWPDYRHPHKQIGVQPPFATFPFRFTAFFLQLFYFLRCGAQQAVLIEEFGKFGDLLFFRRQGGAGVDVLHHLGRRQMPAQQALIFQPANAVEAVGDGVLNRPCRSAIREGGALMQLQVFAQRWRWRCRWCLFGLGGLAGLCRVARCQQHRRGCLLAGRRFRGSRGAGWRHQNPLHSRTVASGRRSR